jgi:hypothetical protein
LETYPGDYKKLEGGVSYYTSISLPNNCNHLPVIFSSGPFNYRVYFLIRNVKLYFVEGNLGHFGEFWGSLGEFGAISKSQLFTELFDKPVAPKEC